MIDDHSPPSAWAGSRARPTRRRGWARRARSLRAGLVALTLLVAACTGGIPSGDGTSPATPTNTASCPTTARVLVDPMLLPAVDRVLADYRTGFAPDCEPIVVEARDSRAVAQEGLGDAAAWIPEGLSWQARSTVTTVVSKPVHAIGWSPAVLIAPSALAETLPNQSLTGATLVELITGAKTFADFGQRDWGQLKLVLPTPNDSITGTLGFIGLAELVADGQGFPASPAAASPEQRRMPTVEWRTVAHAAPSEVPGMLAPNPQDAPRALGVGPRAGVTSELVALNQPSDSDLRAWHIDGARRGVLFGVVGGGTPTIDTFISWLTGPQGQDALLAAGIRVGDRAPAAADLQAVGLPIEGVSEPARLGQTGWAQAAQAYVTFSHRTSTLAVIDAWASMGEPLGNSGIPKLDIIAAATLENWGYWPPGSVTGLMTFQTNASGRPVFQQRIPLQPTDTPEYVANLNANAAQFRQIQARGSAPVNSAIWEAYSLMEREYRPGFTHQIIVLTDGHSDPRSDSLTADQLIANINGADPSKRITVGLVVLGTDQSFATMERIAEETGNRAWLVRSQNEVAQVLPELTNAFANN